MSDETTSIYLSGNFAPVDEEVTAFDLAVTGTIPPELDGRLLRNGPNPLVAPDPATHHWFLGSGMVHGLRLEGGRAAWYRNRWVRSEETAAVWGEPDPGGPRHGMGAAGPNTNVIGHAGRTWALVEAGGLPAELTDELDTVGRNDWDGTLDGSFTAHPKLDPATGELHAVTYYWEWDHVRHVVVGPDARVRREVRVPVAGGPMIHDCAVTENHVVLLDLPVTFDLEAAMTGTAFPYVWNPEHPARVGLLAREGDGGDVTWHDVAPCYVFHVLNAFEDVEGRVVIDVVRHPRMFDRDRLGPNEGPTRLDRWTVDPAVTSVHERTLDDHSVELPRHDERRSGRPYRYGYAMTAGPGFAHGPAVKYDLEAGITELHDYGPGRQTLEPVFVPRPGGSAEDDGWVLSYVYDAAEDSSSVVVLAAQDFAGEPVATVELPQRVPFGFHGNWVPASA